MTIDHAGYALFPEYPILRIIGRMAMPIFAFQIAIGFRHTSSKGKYMLRMFLCALFSELPFLLLSATHNIPKTSNSFTELFYAIEKTDFSLNICFAFLIALLILFFYEKGKETKIFYLISIYMVALSFIVPMDYDWFAVFLVLTFYFCNNNKTSYTFISMLFCIMYNLYAYTFLNQIVITEFYMFFSFPLLYLYNGKKGKGLKYLFYAFYPLHMLIIVMIRLLIVHA